MARKGGYPDIYGTPLKGVLPDMATPLNIENEGDVLVPPNDMRAVGGPIGNTGPQMVAPDPLDFIRRFGDGKS